SAATAAARGLEAHAFGHLGIGIIHLLVRVTEPQRAAAEGVRDAPVEAALRLGGSCSGEHGMGIGNRRYAAREHGEALERMRAIKDVFDPRGILNPGKMWGKAMRMRIVLCVKDVPVLSALRFGPGPRA